jgi:hypothetical protein
VRVDANEDLVVIVNKCVVQILADGWNFEAEKNQ